MTDSLIKYYNVYQIPPRYSLFLKKRIWVVVAACGISFPDQGLNPGSLPWECRVVVTGSPGKSSRYLF